MKKNQGFSLVELIVVIAIMAVLVGVLAPAYLRYVEKSRKSTDISAISDIMAAGEKVAIDPQFTNEGIKYLKVSEAGGKITIATSKTASADEATAKETMLSEWTAICNAKSASEAYTIKSKAFNDLKFSFQGEIKDTGAVTWTASGADKLIEFSPDFATKWGLTAKTE